MFLFFNKGAEKGTAEMSLPFSVLVCLSVVQLCVGYHDVEEVIQAEKSYMLGGWVEINPESADVQDAAQHVVRTINSKAKYKKMFKLILVSSAKRQVTNAINFKVDMVLGRTKCLNSGNHDLNNCTLTKRQLQCNSDVLFNPSDSRHHVQNYKCKKLVTKV
ncbi:cystatin-F isoform X2 [Oryzias latipes]|uniref:Si:busm1-57f23.1 n=2 Tax=Oryzias latipes TaxID=8090 RepID=H2M951_ORYLA|nr:cystatin-F isoform X2 [Oryzias latipes]